MPPSFGFKGPTLKSVALAPKGYDHNWKKLRDKRLAANPLCQHCEAQGYITPAKEVDHITPRGLGGKDTWDNTQSLCKPCHKAKTKQDIRDMKGG